MANLEIQVILNYTQSHLVLLGDTREFIEAEATKDAVNFRAHVFTDFHD